MVIENNHRSKIEETLAAEPNITITTNVDDVSLKPNETKIRIDLPHGCYREGKVIDYGEGNIWLMGKMTQVPDELQKNGIGERLSKFFFEEGKRLGANKVYIEAWSQGGLKLTAKLHGAENLTFHNVYTREILDDMTYDKALKLGDDIRLGISAYFS